MNIPAIGYLQALERLDIEERVEYLAKCLAGPLEEGVRPVLVRHYLDLTDRDGMPVSDSNLTERAEA